VSIRLGQSWQIMLADLSLILFIATAAALDAAPAEEALHGAGMPTSEIASEPSALFRASGRVHFGRWLSEHPADPRERLTILARYAPGEREAALNDAEALAEQAAAAGFAPRLVVEPGSPAETLAMFDFAAQPGMARRLHEAALHNAGTSPAPNR
jgi:hypothetical protein